MTINQLLRDVLVHSDWRARTLQDTARRLRLWRATEVAVTTATLATVVSGTFLSAESWGLAQRAIVYVGVFLLVPLILIRNLRQDSLQSTLWAMSSGLALLLAIAVALISIPLLASDAVVPFLPALVALLALATWPMAVYMSRRYPTQARQLGLVWNSWSLKMLAGLAAGLALGFHMLITSRFMPVPPAAPAFPLSTILWVTLALTWLRALAEELFFRGWCYHLQFHNTPVISADATAKIVLLNLLAYTGYAMIVPSGQVLAWLLIYEGRNRAA